MVLFLSGRISGSLDHPELLFPDWEGWRDTQGRREPEIWFAFFCIHLPGLHKTPQAGGLGSRNIFSQFWRQ